MTKAAIYSRVSTDIQAVKGYSLGEQDLICSKYILDKGYTFVERVHEEISGTTYSRPEMDKLIKLAKEKAIDVVVVQELDRFSRGLTPMVIFENQLKQHGVRVEYALNQFEDSPTGDFMKTMLAGIAELERQKIQERMSRGKNGKARSGKVVQSPNPPYGYEFRDNMYHIIEHEALVVRDIYYWYTREQLGYVQIANRLTANAVPTRSDNVLSAAIRTKAAGVWNMSTVRNILNNRVYIGEYIWGKKNPIIVPVPPIIAPELFSDVQNQKKNNVRFNRRNASVDYLLTGMMYCKTCGQRFYGLTKNKNSSIRYYRCGSQVPDHKPYPGYQSECPQSYIKADIIEAAVWEAVAQAIQKPELITGELRKRQREQATAVANRDGQIAALQAQIDKIAQQEKRLLSLYLENSFDQAILVSKGDELKAIRSKLEADADAIISAPVSEMITEESAVQFETYCRKIRQGLKNYNAHQKKSTLKLLGIEVLLDKRDGSIEIKGMAGDLVASYFGYMQYCLIPNTL